MYLLILVGLIGAVYLYLKHNYNFWQRLKVPGPPGEFLFGNMRDVMTFKKNIGQQLNTMYNDYKDCDFIGYYKFLQPAILLRSPELINKVFVKDFDHFNSNDFQAGEHDEILSRNAFMVSGAKWKRIRTSITSAFTSGKLKNMVPLTLKASDNMIEYIKSNMSTLNQSSGFDARDMALRFTTDNTASIAFGLEANSFDQDGSTFMDMCKRAFNLTNFWVALKFTVRTFLPSVANILKIQFIDSTVRNYFANVIDKTIQYRKETGSERNDILNQFLELRKKLGDDEFGEIDVLAQAIQIILNGSEASAATMGFMLYLLATNPEVQEKAKIEIDEVFEKHNNQLNYEAIQQMKYLDQLINETLRIYPATLVNLKVCTTKYTIPKTENTPALTIEAGTPVSVSVRSINMDEKYFPNPEKFDPERFSQENAENVPRNVFLPFGDGPRICLGQRYALIQIKIGMVRLLHEYKVTLNKNTILPVELSPRSFLSRSTNPMYVNFHKL